MKKTILFFLFLFLVPMVLAVPADYWGTVTVNGELATDGTVVTAFIGGQLQDTYSVGEISVANQYLVHVLGEEGDLVTFQINGHNADQTANWISGGYELNLTATYNTEVVVTTTGGGGGGGGRPTVTQTSTTPTEEETTPTEDRETTPSEGSNEQLNAGAGEQTETTKNPFQKFLSAITGAAVFQGMNATTAWAGLIIALVILALFLIFAVFRKKK